MFRRKISLSQSNSRALEVVRLAISTQSNAPIEFLELDIDPQKGNAPGVSISYVDGRYTMPNGDIRDFTARVFIQEDDSAPYAGMLTLKRTAATFPDDESFVLHMKERFMIRMIPDYMHRSDPEKVGHAVAPRIE